jgi:tetrahydromethanopterin S-methyltransferase subunit G
MSALNIPSADDFERLERRLRSVSNRLEELEDRLDEMADEVVAARAQRSGASRDR